MTDISKPLALSNRVNDKETLEGKTDDQYH